MLYYLDNHTLQALHAINYRQISINRCTMILYIKQRIQSGIGPYDPTQVFLPVHSPRQSFGQDGRFIPCDLFRIYFTSSILSRHSGIIAAIIGNNVHIYLGVLVACIRMAFTLILLFCGTSYK